MTCVSLRNADCVGSLLRAGPHINYELRVFEVNDMFVNVKATSLEANV